MIFATEEWVSQEMLAIKAFGWPLSLVWGHVSGVLVKSLEFPERMDCHCYLPACWEMTEGGSWPI